MIKAITTITKAILIIAILGIIGHFDYEDRVQTAQELERAKADFVIMCNSHEMPQDLCK